MARGLQRWSEPPWWAWGAMIVSVVIVVVGLPLASGRGELPAGATAAARSEADERRAQWAAQDEAERPRTVAFVGDSYTGGGNTFGEGEAGWPRIVAKQFGWHLAGGDLFAAGGTGYLNQGPEEQGALKFLNRLKPIIEAHPDIVIVAGGINDAEHYPTKNISVAAEEFLTGLRNGLPDAMIVVVGPFYPREAPRQWLDARTVIFEAAAKINAPTIDPLPWFTGENAVEISSDGTHPSDEGHAQIAEHMIAALQALNVPVSVSSG